MRHKCPSHTLYGLSCDEFEGMVDAAGGSCQRCHRSGAQLVIDHDHSGGKGAVRGLICHRCNSRLGQVDRGWSKPNDLDAAYLAAPWHATQEHRPLLMSDMAPLRTVRIDDDLWATLREAAGERGEPVTAAIARAIQAYVDADSA